MGVAAYNRGSKAISDQIFPQVHRVKPTPKPVESNLPEGVLRSSFLPDNDSNTQIFLSYENGWYVIHTRFQAIRRRRSYAKGVEIFERLEMYGRFGLEGM
jgi:hypothetical protein